MKKRFCAVLFLLSMCFLLGGCSQKNSNKNQISKEEFADIQWTRQTEVDTEYISFSSDGSFSYYCACGNPVNDSDLCEGYTYDDKTNTIELNCMETTDNMVTTIIVKNCSENSLELDFDGEIRSFTKE